MCNGYYTEILTACIIVSLYVFERESSGVEEKREREKKIIYRIDARSDSERFFVFTLFEKKKDIEERERERVEIWKTHPSVHHLRYAAQIVIMKSHPFVKSLNDLPSSLCLPTETETPPCISERRNQTVLHSPKDHPR